MAGGIEKRNYVHMHIIPVSTMYGYWWRRRGWGWYPPATPEEELAELEAYKRSLEEALRELQDELKSVEARIEELRKAVKEGAQPTQPPPPPPPPPAWGPGGGWGWGPRGGWWAPQYPAYGPGYAPSYPPGPAPYPAPYPRMAPQAPELPPPPEGGVRVVAPVEGDEGLDSKVAGVFARAPYLAVVDVAGGKAEVRVVPNPYAGAPGGAGPGLVDWVLGVGAAVVVAPGLGVNAARAAEAAGLRVVSVEPGVTLRDALKKAGILKEE